MNNITYREPDTSITFETGADVSEENFERTERGLKVKKLQENLSLLKSYTPEQLQKKKISDTVLQEWITTIKEELQKLNA